MIQIFNYGEVRDILERGKDKPDLSEAPCPGSDTFFL